MNDVTLKLENVKSCKEYPLKSATTFACYMFVCNVSEIYLFMREVLVNHMTQLL